jgi:single-stranded-DNA-specific exonuclease
MTSLSVSGKNWLFKKFDSSDIIKFSENYNLSEIVAKLLSIRKKNIIDLNLFLNPKIKNMLPNPFLLKDMDAAVSRTYQSLIKKDAIGIFGDYDVDGASSTALLYKYFLSIKQKIYTYIPDRQKEGYGPNKNGFKNLIDLGSKIIFTVDCGTSSFEAIKYAQNLSTDIIVLDHHQSDIKLPNAHAVVNPNRYDDTSDLQYLCAAGVCFVYLVALNKKLREMNWFMENNISEPNILNFLDLVSLGTVCDVVPLIGLNRAIVKQGLKIIKKRSNLGLKTLYDICKIESQPTTSDLGYKLGPRINAGGRVGKSSHGAELLISEDPQTTYKIAVDLDKSNKERQAIELILTNQVNAIVKQYHNHPVLVLPGGNWHEGLIGIVASRIKDKYGKPTIIISVKGDVGKGSARSITGFDIGSDILKAVKLNILEKGGGHKMAGGFTIKKNNIDKFRDFLIKSYERKNFNEIKKSNIYLDAQIAPSALNEEFYKDINYLAPFGPGNSEPRFVIENIQVISSKIISDKHIFSILRGKDGSIFKGYAWNAKNGPLDLYLTNNSKKNINIVGKMQLNEWQGKKNIDFLIEDISLF